MRSVERIQQSKLSPIFFQEAIIQVLKFHFQIVHPYRLIFFLLYFLLRLEHRMK